MRLFYRMRKWISRMRLLSQAKRANFREKKETMPCSFVTLHQSPNTFVRYCASCGRYRVGFYTLHMELNEVNFQIFCRYVRERLDQISEIDQIINERNLVLETPAHGYRIWLTPNELQELAQILDEAATEKSVQEVIGKLRIM